MSEGKERIVAEHPKAWVVRMVEGRGLKVAEKTLYWWSVQLERFLKFCRSAGAESSEIPEVAAGLFLESLPVGGSAQEFAREQARMALDVFIGEMVGCSWGEDRYGRVGPKFRFKANSAGWTTEDTESTEGDFKQKKFSEKISTAFSVFRQTAIPHFLLRALRVLRG